MPEGPEVKYLATFLSNKFKNKNLTDMSIISGRYIKKPPQNLSPFIKSLPSKIKTIHCKGKFMYIILANDWSIWFTLGLTGTFFTNCAGRTIDERGVEVGKYCRIKFTTLYHSTRASFFYSDMRNFGTISLVPPKDKDLLEPRLQTLGNDPLYATAPKEISAQLQDFITAVKSQRNQSQPIGGLLLKQNVLAGVGNYIRAMALYNAKISPHRTLKSLTTNQLKAIYLHIHKIMHSSYKKQRFSGLHTYPLTVYRKTYTPKGHPVRADEMPKGRHIYWSPAEQF